MAHIHYGWPASPYSAKSRAALRVSGLEWTEARPHGLTFAWLEAHVGKKVIPVLRTPEGEFIQDSSRIVDAIERRSGRAMTPSDPLARVLALWLEVFGDEWMIYPAMYFRWRYRGGDFDFMVRDFGSCALPGAPKAVQEFGGKTVAQAMNRYLPIMGIDETTGPAMEATTLRLLDTLNACLEAHPFILGDAPCIGDFALYGPIAAHIGRDPWSAHVIDDRPAIRRWVRDLDTGRVPPAPLPLSDTGLSETQRALFEQLFQIGAPAWAAAHACARDKWTGSESTLRRRVGEFEAKLQGPTGEVVHPHKLTAVTVWKMHRPIRALRHASQQARAQAAQLLGELGAAQLAGLELLEGLTLDSITWKRDKTSFGGLGAVIERLTPFVRHIPPRRPVHPKRRGPVEALG